MTTRDGLFITFPIYTYGEEFVKGPSGPVTDRTHGSWYPKAEAQRWVQAIQDSCLRYGTKFFFKQWGGPLPTTGGNLLDDRTWDEFPEDVPS